MVKEVPDQGLRQSCQVIIREMWTSWNENYHFKTLATISTVDTCWNDEKVTNGIV